MTEPKILLIIRNDNASLEREGKRRFPVTGDPVVDAVWRRLLDRAGPRPDFALTHEPDLHLPVDGTRVDGVRCCDDRYAFQIAATAAEIRITSHAAAPAELGLSRDPRVLGVGVRQLHVVQGRHLRVMEAPDEALCNGFHDYEADNNIRWTNGAALVPAALLAGVAGNFWLEVLVAGRTQYALLAEAA